MKEQKYCNDAQNAHISYKQNCIYCFKLIGSDEQKSYTLLVLHFLLHNTLIRALRVLNALCYRLRITQIYSFYIGHNRLSKKKRRPTYVEMITAKYFLEDLTLMTEKKNVIITRYQNYTGRVNFVLCLGFQAIVHPIDGCNA